MKSKAKTKAIIVVLALIVLILILTKGYERQEASKISNFYECVAAGNPIMESYPRQCRDSETGRTFTEDLEKPIGGQRDNSGCLGSAGYSWNESYGLCVREWELSDLDRKLLLASSEYLEEDYGLTFIETIPGDCEECYILRLDTLGRLRTVDIKTNGTVELSLSPEECLAKGGYPLNVVGGDECPSGESNIGKVVGFISPNICCVPYNVTLCTAEQRNTESCITLWEPVCGYPLEETFSNSCMACMSDQIDYYVEGECE